MERVATCTRTIYLTGEYVFFDESNSRDRKSDWRVSHVTIFIGRSDISKFILLTLTLLNLYQCQINVSRHCSYSIISLLFTKTMIIFDTVDLTLYSVKFNYHFSKK